MSCKKREGYYEFSGSVSNPRAPPAWHGQGIVLHSASGTYVLCAPDWCVILGSTYDFSWEEIAKAAGGIPCHKLWFTNIPPLL